MRGTAGQGHIPADRACDQCNDHRGRHTRRDFTSKVFLGNENALYIWATWILLCKFSICLCSSILGVCFTKLNLVNYNTELFLGLKYNLAGYFKCDLGYLAV